MAGKGVSKAQRFLALWMLVTYTAEICMFAVVLHSLWLSNDIIHFGILVSVLGLSLVVVQILSLHWLVRSGAHKEQLWLTISHLILMSLPVRYCLLVAGYRNTKQDSGIHETTRLSIIRLVHTGIACVPLSYLVFNIYWDIGMTNALYLSTSIVGVISATSVFSLIPNLYRWRKHEEPVIPSGLLLRFVWRFGELASRGLVFVLFASLYNYWVFLIVAMHWGTILTWATVHASMKGVVCRLPTVCHLSVIAYVNTYAFIGTKLFQPQYRILVYYLILSMENATLVIVCIVFAWRDTASLCLGLVATGLYVVSLIAGGIYGLCRVFEPKEVKDELEIKPECADCKLNYCLKHNIDSGLKHNGDEKQRSLNRCFTYARASNNSAATSINTVTTLDTNLTASTASHPKAFEGSYTRPVGHEELNNYAFNKSTKERRHTLEDEKCGVIDLIIRESGTMQHLDAEDLLRAQAVASSTQFTQFMPSNNHKNNKHGTRRCSASSVSEEGDSEYMWDNYDLLQSVPEEEDVELYHHVTPSSPSLDEEIDRIKTRHKTRYNDANESDLDKSSCSETSSVRGRRGSRPSIVCGAEFHKRRKQHRAVTDPIIRTRLGSDRSRTSSSTVVTVDGVAPNYMIVRPQPVARVKPAVVQSPRPENTKVEDIRQKSPLDRRKAEKLSARATPIIFHSEETDYTPNRCDRLNSLDGQSNPCFVESGTSDIISTDLDSMQKSVLPKSHWNTQNNNTTDAYTQIVNPEPSSKVVHDNSYHSCQKSSTSDYGSLLEADPVVVVNWDSNSDAESSGPVFYL